VESEELRSGGLARVDGTLTVTDTMALNVLSKYIVDTVLPPNIQYCTITTEIDNTGLFDDYCRRTGGNNALLIICDQLEAQDSSKAWHHLCCAEAALAKLWRR
jgi:hypothetical protein